MIISNIRKRKENKCFVLQLQVVFARAHHELNTRSEKYTKKTKYKRVASAANANTR